MKTTGICRLYVESILEKGSVDGRHILLSHFINLKVSVKTDLVLPRSGMYFVEFLSKLNFKNKKVLDIGTGYFGYLSKHAKFFGAKNITAVDINQEAINFAKKKYFSKYINYKIGDVYSPIGKREKFDIIISNPPQLPSKMGGELHDVAGEDGLLVIRKILSKFKDHSFKDGEGYLLVFDFLYKQTKKLSNIYGLNCEIVAYYVKKIRKGGETEKRLNYIQKICQGYKFYKENNNFYHRVFILKIKRYENNH